LPGIYGGGEKITFIQVHYQSLLGSNMIPVIYNYTMPYVTNGLLAQVAVTRTVTVPDIVFSAGDLISNTTPPSWDVYTISPVTYVVDGTVQLSAGGNVVSSVYSPHRQVTFNSGCPCYVDVGSVEGGAGAYLDQYTGIYPVFWWGSFDGSTNAPVIFPNGSSISALESQILSGPGSGSGQVQGMGSSWNPVNLVNTNAAATGGTGAGGGG
jgi:hypothetical protein